MSARKRSPHLPLKHWLITLGSVRDGMLVGVGALYLLGFLSWSIFARLMHMGVAPALQAQYFVAGLPALLFLGVAGWLVVALRRFLFGLWFRGFRRMRMWKRWLTVVTLFVFALGAAAYVYLLPTLNLHGSDTVTPTWARLAVLLVLVVLTAMLLALLGNGVADQLLLTVFLASILLVYVYAGLVTFVAVAYTRWPQHLGGGKLLCAQIDLYTERLSKASLDALAGTPAQPHSGVVRSKEVGLIFASNDILFVYRHESPGPLRYELRRSDVAAVVWCRN